MKIAVRIVAVIAAVLVYAIWKNVDVQLGLGAFSAFARGVVVLGGLSWAWVAVGREYPSEAK